jgi:hypothetical protein
VSPGRDTRLAGRALTVQQHSGNIPRSSPFVSNLIEWRHSPPEVLFVTVSPCAPERFSTRHFSEIVFHQREPHLKIVSNQPTTRCAVIAPEKIASDEKFVALTRRGFYNLGINLLPNIQLPQT